MDVWIVQQKVEYPNKENYAAEIFNDIIGVFSTLKAAVDYAMLHGKYEFGSGWNVVVAKYTIED